MNRSPTSALSISLGASLTFAAAAAIGGCGSTFTVDGGDNPNDTGGGVTDTGTVLPDGRIEPPASVCQARVTIDLPINVAEIRSTVALPINIDLADDGGAKDPHPIKVLLTKDGATVKTLLDGPKALGKIPIEITPGSETNLATGAYAIKVDAGCPASATDSKPGSATTPLFFVRLGATKIMVKNGEGGGRVQLMYHAVDHSTGVSPFPITDVIPATSFDIGVGEAELDGKDGSARTFPAPWDDLETPPVDTSGAVKEDGATLPVSLVVGTKPDLVFTIGKTAKSGTGTQPTGLTVPALPPVRLVVEGIAPSDTALAKEGEDLTLRLAATPVPAIDKVDYAVKWHFETKTTAGAWVAIAGAQQSATLRFYGVLGNDQGTSSPNIPWVAVVDEATKAIAGKATDAPGARNILVSHIYSDIKLTYDRKSGASHYTSYSGGWVNGNFNLHGFLKRSNGNIVNCSDCASTLSTYANMIGAKLHYSIIGFSFKLNPIQGIGATSFGSPFDSGAMGFSYHAVTSFDGSATIHDATLAVDGDSDPKTAPYVLKLVQALTGADYLTRLSPDYPAKPSFAYPDQKTSVY